MPKETVGQSKTLFRGLSILKACSGSRSGLTLVEIAGINAPVFNELAAPVCALSMSGPGVRIAEEVLIRHGDAVAQTANQATQLVGGIPQSHWVTYD